MMKQKTTGWRQMLSLTWFAWSVANSKHLQVLCCREYLFLQVHVLLVFPNAGLRLHNVKDIMSKTPVDALQQSKRQNHVSKY